MNHAPPNVVDPFVIDIIDVPALKVRFTAESDIEFDKFNVDAPKDSARVADPFDVILRAVTVCQFVSKVPLVNVIAALPLLRFSVPVSVYVPDIVSNTNAFPHVFHPLFIVYDPLPRKLYISVLAVSVPRFVRFIEP